MLQTVAIIGPVRFGVPLTQALTAPLLGVLRGARRRRARADARVRGDPAGPERAHVGVRDRGADRARRLPRQLRHDRGRHPAAAGGARGGVDRDRRQPAGLGRLRERGPGLGLPPRPALLARPGEEPRCTCDVRRGPSRARSGAGRFDPRAVALAAAIAFGLLVSSISWALLAAVAAWLVGRRAHLARRPLRRPLGRGAGARARHGGLLRRDARRAGHRGLARARRPRGAAGAGRDVAAGRGRHRGPAGGVAAGARTPASRCRRPRRRCS